MTKPRAQPAQAFHPIADLFPLMEGPALDALAEDIKRNGLIHPIILYERAILDGRNRYTACLRVGVEPRFMPYEGNNPLGYVMGSNLARRHLNETQRAMIANRLATMPIGGNQHSKRASAYVRPLVSKLDAAKMLEVSLRSVSAAHTVAERGIDALEERADRGEIAITLAEKIAKLPEAEQRALVAVPEKEIVSAVKRARRAQREVALAEATAQAGATLGDKRYSVILADPPWRFEPWGENGLDRAADNHYPTLTVGQLYDIEPPAADDCVLFLWATAPMLPEAMAVLDAWGFEYKTHFVWVKDRAGTGYWCRSRHELLLIATRGHIPAPAPGQQFDSVFEAFVGRHSEKPAAAVEIIETMFPHAVLLEMFARGPRLGWETWGNEAAAAPAQMDHDGIVA